MEVSVRFSLFNERLSHESREFPFVRIFFIGNVCVFLKYIFKFLLKKSL